MLKRVKNIRSKYYNPQREDSECKCDFPGCNKPGEFRAPKDRSLKEYYWFCLEHVQAYNAKWNYYDGDFDEKADKKTKSRMHFGRFKSRVKYQFGYDFKDEFEFFNTYSDDYQPRAGYSSSHNEFLQIMEISEEELSLPRLKKQYKKLVKKYHPDVNREDKDAEEKFKRLTIAYQTLLKALS